MYVFGSCCFKIIRPILLIDIRDAISLCGQRDEVSPKGDSDNLNELPVQFL